MRISTHKMSFFKLRQTVSDFAVMLAIVIMVLIDMYMGIDTPKLNVPRTFRVRSSFTLSTSHALRL